MARQEITRKNHYLPQRYQLGFAKDEMIWVYDRQADSFRHGHPKTVAFINDFYTTQGPEGEPTDEVEKVLAMVEGTVWSLLARLDSHKREWGVDDRANLALFAALLKTRVPAFDAQQSQFAEDFFRWWAKVTRPSPEAITKSVAEETGESTTLEQALEMHQIIHDDEYILEHPRQNNIKTMLKISLDLATAFLRMDWTVLWSPKRSAFILSDNPCLLVPPPDFDDTLGGVGVLTPGATTFIPLSSKTLLCLQYEQALGSEVRYGIARKDFVRSFNLSIAASSDRFIMARDEAHLRCLVKSTRAGQWRNESRIHFSPPPPNSHEPFA